MPDQGTRKRAKECCEAVLVLGLLGKMIYVSDVSLIIWLKLLGPG